MSKILIPFPVFALDCTVWHPAKKKSKLYVQLLSRRQARVRSEPFDDTNPQARFPDKEGENCLRIDCLLRLSMEPQPHWEHLYITAHDTWLDDMIRKVMDLFMQSQPSWIWNVAEIAHLQYKAVEIQNNYLAQIHAIQKEIYKLDDALEGVRRPLASIPIFQDMAYKSEPSGRTHWTGSPWREDLVE